MAPQVLPSGPDLSRWQRMHLFTVRENIVVCDSEPDVAVTQPSKASTQVGSLSQRQAPQFGVQPIESAGGEEFPQARPDR
jgi:hypothetical protein